MCFFSFFILEKALLFLNFFLKNRAGAKRRARGRFFQKKLKNNFQLNKKKLLRLGKTSPQSLLGAETECPLYQNQLQFGWKAEFGFFWPHLSVLKCPRKGDCRQAIHCCPPLFSVNLLKTCLKANFASFYAYQDALGRAITGRWYITALDPVSCKKFLKNPWKNPKQNQN